MKFSFAGKKVLVTGAAQGLGRVIVEKFVESGATVFALDVNAGLLNDLHKLLPTIVPVPVDLANWEEARRAVEALGPFDHLVNNAGIISFEPLLESSDKAINKIFDVNFKAVLNLSITFAKSVIQNSTTGTSIVNISSLAGQRPFPVAAVYCCSKAAVDNLTKSLAIEFATHGIRVNAIAPGAMPTALMASLPEEMLKHVTPIMDRQLVKGTADLEDVAFHVLYLSSPFAKFITGNISTIDGGLQVA